MPAVIQLELSPEVATALAKKRPDSPEAKKLLKTAKGLGVSLSPVHPGVNDPLLARQFVAIVPDHDKVDDVVRQLQAHSNAVESAYVKPMEYPP